MTPPRARSTPSRRRLADLTAAAIALSMLAALPGSQSLPRPVADLHPADHGLDRAGRNVVAGGVLSIPFAFRSQDGLFDLLVHFHGNTDLVEESVAAADLDAVLVVVNLGIGSAVYDARFTPSNAFPDLLARTEATLARRGLRGAHVGRVALSAWSAGYGAVLRILDRPENADRVDAVILLDGLHVGVRDGDGSLFVERLASLDRFAREAMKGRRLLSITHSEIIPPPTYASTHETADVLLRNLGVARVPGGEAPVMPSLHAMSGVLPKDELVPLEPLSIARRGGLCVRGYAGDSARHHVLHLVEMSATALPDLVSRWTQPR